MITPSGLTYSELGDDSHKPIKPNGIALEPDGTFLMAHLGATTGGIYRLGPSGAITSVVTHANGVPLPPTNFVTLDKDGRVWLTVSTTEQPRDRDFHANACTGFIAVAEPGQTNATIVADQLGYANECVIDSGNAVVYVNETFAKRLTRFDLADDATLSNRQTITTFGPGTYPDGVALDEQGCLWITSIVSNRIIKVSPDGKQENIIEDADEAYVTAAETAYQNNTMNREHLAATGDTTLANTSSLAFAGDDLSIAIVGNLLGDCLHQFNPGVRGKAPVHWHAPLGHLEQYV